MEKTKKPRPVANTRCHGGLHAFSRFLIIITIRHSDAQLFSVKTIFSRFLSLFLTDSHRIAKTTCVRHGPRFFGFFPFRVRDSRFIHCSVATAPSITSHPSDAIHGAGGHSETHRTSVLAGRKSVSADRLDTCMTPSAIPGVLNACHHSFSTLLEKKIEDCSSSVCKTEQKQSKTEKKLRKAEENFENRERIVDNNN